MIFSLNLRSDRRSFNLTSYVWGVALELREALKGLIEEEMSE